MKIFKIGLRVWIAIVSVFSFFLGWILFAHSAKPVSILSQPSQPQPVQSSQLQPIPTLPPINDLQTGAQNFQPIQPQPPQTFFQPSLRTRGS
jgi:hypothetical protein